MVFLIWQIDCQVVFHSIHFHKIGPTKGIFMSNIIPKQGINGPIKGMFFGKDDPIEGIMYVFSQYLSPQSYIFVKYWSLTVYNFFLWSH